MIIKDQKLHYDINREVAKISALSPGKIDKYEYLTGEEILLSERRRVIEQATFTCSPLGKALEKQTKTFEEQGKKQIKSIEDHGKQLVESNELVKKDLNPLSTGRGEGGLQCTTGVYFCRELLNGKWF